MYKASLKMTAHLGLLLGLLLFTFLIAYQGMGEIMEVLILAGWGILWVILFHLFPMLADILGWRTLLSDEERVSLPSLFWARWLGEAVNNLLPAMQLGGHLVRARWITRRGVPGPHAGASVVVDLTMGLLTQVLFTLLGFAVLLIYLDSGEIAIAILLGLAVTGLLLGIFYRAQRRGLFSVLVRTLEYLVRGRGWATLTNKASALDDAVVRLYKDRQALAVASLWRLLGWIIGLGEVWLALHFLGQPVTWLQALMLESLGQALRVAGFTVPGALGIQEGVYLVLGGLIGLNPEVSLALSLIKRVRELVWGVPGLIGWQLESAKGLIRTANSQATVRPNHEP